MGFIFIWSLQGQVWCLSSSVSLGQGNKKVPWETNFLNCMTAPPPPHCFSSLNVEDSWSLWHQVRASILTSYWWGGKKKTQPKTTALMTCATNANLKVKELAVTVTEAKILVGNTQFPKSRKPLCEKDFGNQLQRQSVRTWRAAFTVGKHKFCSTGNSSVF